ncbi:uncharacterized protein LOC144581492 [Callithrix jacchus]
MRKRSSQALEDARPQDIPAAPAAPGPRRRPTPGQPCCTCPFRPWRTPDPRTFLLHLLLQVLEDARPQDDLAAPAPSDPGRHLTPGHSCCTFSFRPWRTPNVGTFLLHLLLQALEDA